jgi:hypothetical protein
MPENPNPILAKAEASAEWLIAQIKAEARVSQSPFEKWDEWVLRQTFADFSEEDVPHVLQTHNDSVMLVRAAIVRAKKSGAPTIKVRQGLSLPTNWQSHYEVVFATELPWVVSVVMQNAFFGNPLTGEEKAWNSDFVISDGVKKAAGWGAAGAIIASLFGG